jgi:hypothetical protein
LGKSIRKTVCYIVRMENTGRKGRRFLANIFHQIPLPPVEGSKICSGDCNPKISIVKKEH